MGKDSVDQTQQEIAEEMAKALGHSGDLLESILMKLDELGKMLDTIEDIGKYNLLVEEFNTLRKEAVFRRDMLLIHREAIGIRGRQVYLDTFYPIPKKKRKKTADEKG